jgi:hypothetical protein
MAYWKSMACAGALVLVTAVSAPAMGRLPIDRDPHHPIVRPAPGPIAGIGLPVAALVGGYLWYSRRFRRDKR